MAKEQKAPYRISDATKAAQARVRARGPLLAKLLTDIQGGSAKRSTKRPKAAK